MPQNFDMGIQQIPNGDEWPEARRTASIMGARKVGVDSLPKDTKDDIAFNLADEVKELKSRGMDGRDVYHEVFGLGQEPMVTVGYADPAVLRKQFQPNRKTSEVAVGNYRKMLRNGVEFDPVIVSHGKFLDGGHRVEAYLQEGRDRIPVVDIGSLMDMDWEKWLSGDEGYFPFKASDNRTATIEARELLGMARSLLCGMSPKDKPYAKIRDLHRNWSVKGGLTTRDPEEASVFTRREVREFLRFRIPQSYIIVGLKGIDMWDGRMEMSF